MTMCEHCGERKAGHTIKCERCGQLDQQVMHKMMAGTPLLTLAVIGVVGLSIYRFWHLGWIAWAGNLRAAALLAIAAAFTALLFGSLWTFGIRHRGQAVVWLVIAVPIYLWLNAM